MHVNFVLMRLLIHFRYTLNMKQIFIDTLQIIFFETVQIAFPQFLFLAKGYEVTLGRCIKRIFVKFSLLFWKTRFLQEHIFHEEGVKRLKQNFVCSVRD